jgi:hypothetical protein
MGDPRAATYLVETYVPRLDRRSAAAVSSAYTRAIRELAQAGVALRLVESYAVVDDETYLCVVSAGNREDVVRMTEQAGLTADHVVRVARVNAG